MSVEEYLRLEEKSAQRHEYVGGFVYPLHAHAGASEAHVLFWMNIAATLYPGAMRAGCRLYQSDMKLRVEDTTSFFSPDVMLVCDQHDTDRQAKTSPCLLVEVLSPSPASHDRVGKYGMYTAIPSLKSHLLVSQEGRYVVEYQRREGGWQMREHREGGEVGVPCLDCTLTLDEMYRAVL
ncbi:Uma2 family endonuclease [Deinococcus sp. HSC-46F16]|uniref:Uma2 family endonuclease n=1 Tax=Deinococcus sp. HSC-46F16 TaxID=2910968 RepID=UPI00209CC7FC|nr:Uma2 family endonuclease [Deinococcus sp. HSC-46F16]MCP2015195.1 Uma2 family endonuclease [Deinococcus sp. HSC-46F16]